MIGTGNMTAICNKTFENRKLILKLTHLAELKYLAAP